MNLNIMYDNLTKEEIELLESLQYDKCFTMTRVFAVSVIGSLTAFFIAKKIFKW